MLSSISNALLPGTVTLLCGSPGASKSFMLLEALAHWMDTDIRGCVFELEEDKDYHLLRALAQRSGLSGMTSPDWIRKNQQEVRKAFEQHNSFLDELARHLTETPDAQPTLEQIARWTGQQAKAGYRLICIDPITAAAQTNKPWIEDNAFLQSIKRIAVAYGTSIVLVTHPKQSFERPDMNALAGGSAYSRFAQTILWLENHSEPKINKLRMSYDTIEQEYNRTLHILKARNGTGQCRLACNFDPETLCLKELGIIVKN
jgi:hypothetical protein